MIRLRRLATSLMEIAGAVSVIVGIGMWSEPAAFVVAGALLIVGAVLLS